ncbi:CZB domain-containing protein [bacterium]|nr:CZB domain-containing protein [bacterium]MBU1884190.1 CZB domain-containing protein [bacterium]
MDKAHTLAQLIVAKSSHVRWAQRAKLLIKGLDIQKDDIPIDSKECEFGKWFYGDGQKLSALSSRQEECISKIEQLHNDLHEKYLNIYNIYFGNHKQGVLSKFFKIRQEVSIHDITKAKEYYDKLEEISNELIAQINLLERLLFTTSNEKIKEIL